MRVSVATATVFEGVRPVLFVFDVRNGYIRQKNGRFFPDANRITMTAAGLFGYQPNGLGRAVLEEVISRHCEVLDNLNCPFDVKAPVLFLEGTRPPDYAQMAGVLPMEMLDGAWPSTAAFVVGLEWLPLVHQKPMRGLGPDDREGWSGAGNVLVHLLSRCYPEVPTFLAMEDASLERFQSGLAHGASWCFGKGFIPAGEAGPRFLPEGGARPLTLPDLVQQLEQTADIRHGAFHQLPFDSQLEIDPSSDAGRALLQRLGIRAPLADSPGGRALQRSIATLFPKAVRVRPVQVLGSGRSAAAATFLVRTQNNRGGGATRFVKVGAWTMIEREYLGYRQVILPRLNSHVANVLDAPVVTLDGQEVPRGAVAYTLAGFPEAHGELCSLGDLIVDKIDGSDGGHQVAKRILETLEFVLFPLWGLTSKGNHSPLSARRSFWVWLGDYLPHLLTGRLVVAGAGRATGDSLPTVKVIRNRMGEGYPAVTSRLLDANDLRVVLKRSGSLNTSDSEDPAGLVELRQFELVGVVWESAGEGVLTLRHPGLGYRVRLRAPAHDLHRSFAPTWIRPGMLVTVRSTIDRESRSIDELADKVDTALDGLGMGGRDALLRRIGPGRVGSGAVVPDPVDVVAGRHFRVDFPVEARQGPIHGDLNLYNVLFAGDQTVGWLIDFEFSREDGMTAYDLAKMEVEVWRFHLLPELEGLIPNLRKDPAGLAVLLETIHAACDQPAGNPALFEDWPDVGHPLSDAANGALLRIRNLVRVVAAIREIALRRMELTPEEMSWAVAAYFTTSLKFEPPDRPLRIVSVYMLAAHRFAEVVPAAPPDWGTFLGGLIKGTGTPGWVQQTDGLLIRIAETGGGHNEPGLPQIDEFTRMISSNSRPVVWPGRVKEVWDLASTGSVANISPIMGYLWLSARARQGTHSVVVPKISSRGKSCGTVDILECGGATFVSDPQEVVRACLRDGSVLCRQDEQLTPLDTLLMKRRRLTGTMKNAALVYASVLGKKIALGCTHVIVDVKVGRDTKMVAPWLGSGATSMVEGDGDGLDRRLMEGPVRLRAFKEMLESMGVKGLSLGDGYIRQQCVTELAPLKEVRWVLTNVDVPQCRAIGRQLILLHLDQLIMGRGGEELLTAPLGGMYSEWYCHRLPGLCGVRSPTIRVLRRQWTALKDRLPAMEKFRTRQFVEARGEFTHHGNFGQAIPLGGGDGDLSVLTLGLAPCVVAGDPQGAHVVRRIGAFALDRLFAWMGGEEGYDPEVGIWLHRLPGETVERADEEPFISVVFHPSRNEVHELLNRIRAILLTDVQLAKA